jgi:hypothetical protein
VRFIQSERHLSSRFFQFSRFGTYSIDQAINAGLDLEMPGINKLRTSENVGRSVVANKLTVHTIKERAKNVLELLQKCAKGAPEVRGSNSAIQHD